MAQQSLNLGTNANDGTGDTLRVAMDKVNDNFTELYNSPLFSGHLTFAGNEISATRSNDDIVFVPSGTGSVTFPSIKINDNNIEGLRTNENINLVPNGTGSVVFGAIKIQGTSFSSDDSTIININDGLIVDGTINVTGTATITGAASLGSTLAVPSALTTLSTLNVTGATSLVGTTTIDNLTLNDNIIGSSSNADIILTPGGTGSVVLPAVTINDNNITGTRSNDDLNINASGTGVIKIGALKFDGTSVSSDDSTTVNVNDNLIVDGTLTTTGAATFTGATNLGSTLAVPSGLTTLSTLNVTSTTSLVGATTIDNLTFDDNTIGSSSNADINLTPGGTGSVILSSLTIDSNINITDNEIKTTQSNSDLVIAPAGTGQVVLSKADINGGTIDDTVIGGTTPAAGSFTTLLTTASLTIDGITIADNTISTNASNSILELSGNGSGGVTISGFNFPTSDGSDGQFLKTDGLGNLAFATASATLSHSDIGDGTTTVATSTTSTLNQFDKTAHRSAKYFISVTDATNSRFEIVEANVITDGTNAYVTTFGSVSDHPTGLAVYSADVDGDNVRLRVTNISDNSTVFKFQRIAIDV